MVKNLASGKEKNGIEEIYEKYYKDVYRFVLALSKNPHVAEDITQEARLSGRRGRICRI